MRVADWAHCEDTECDDAAAWGLFAVTAAATAAQLSKEDEDLFDDEDDEDEDEEELEDEDEDDDEDEGVEELEKKVKFAAVS